MSRRKIMAVPKEPVEIEKAYVPRPRRNITDVVEEPKPVEQMEMIDAPDQFIDTDSVNFIPIQSANGAIRATLY